MQEATIIDTLAQDNKTTMDARHRLDRASIGSLRADSSMEYLKGLEKFASEWLERIKLRVADMEVDSLDIAQAAKDAGEDPITDTDRDEDERTDRDFPGYV